MSEIRVRIAPSPSGFLHVGTARTAIVNWLYARNTGGKFILRIEDTDESRSKEEWVKSIIDSLTWLGLEWDEGPFYQSQRWDLYSSYVDAKAAKADYKYDRTCLNLSGEEIQKKLDAGEPYVVRIKVPEGETAYDDIVYGRMVKQNKDIEDFVVCRRDGRQLYNFVVVVDDHEMGITDVIRGNDHQTNTFKPILIYNSLNLPVPRFAHLPLIFDERKKKISKRDKAANASDYGAQGFLPEAVVNYLSMLGWSPKDDREVFSIPELIEVFDIKGVNKSNAVFDFVKMRHFNGEHIKKKTDHELAGLIAPLIAQAGIYSKYALETRWPYLMDVVGLLKDRADILEDLVERSEYFFQAPKVYDEKGMKKQFIAENAERLEQLAGRFEALGKFDQENLEATLKGMAEELDIKTGQLIHPTRLAVTGMTKGPGLFQLLELLGREETVKRMRSAAVYIKEKAPTES
jgi:glutamyl-tRNA synthetase